uniref:RGS domain-containing protein n=1 Tax=Angiostrongylus cantonensis TaxID=6313 RepID=A0A0K0CTP2_ANGCA
MHIPARSKVYVIDSRRPFHHENIFEGEQIMILVDILVFFFLLYLTKSLTSDGFYYEERDGRGTAKYFKEKKKLWSTRRKNLLWKYYENAWYSISVYCHANARIMDRQSCKLTASMSSYNSWFPCVYVVNHFLQVTTEAYHDVCIDRMRPFIHRFSPRNSNAKADDLLRVSFEKELPLAMYSHWSLYRAMVVSEYFACKTRNWTQKGDSDVKHLLANLGLTLHETRQKFEAMTSTRRKEVMQTLEKEMTPPFASFIAHFGYSNRVNAADVARGMAVRLESPRRIPLVDRFESARDILNCFMKSHQNFSPLVKMVYNTNYFLMTSPQLSSNLRFQIGLECIWTLVASAVNQQEVLPLGPFFLHSSTHPLDDFMDSRHFIFLFTSFLQKAFATVRRSRDRTTKPIIVSLALHVVLIRSEDRSRFFDLLQAVMEIES